MTGKEKKAKSPAERAAEYRERKLAREAPQEAERIAAEKERAAQAEIAERAAEEALKKRKIEVRKIEIEEMQEALVDALAGTAEALASGARAAFMKKSTPAFGTERARRLGKLWAPILAPKMVDAKVNKLPEILAAATTAGIVLEWIDESRAATKEEGK